MRVLIVDGSNLAFRIYSSFVESKAGPLKTSFGIPTSVIFGILNTFESFTKIGSNGSVDKTIVCWDLSGGSKFRKGIFPLYKKNRSYKDMSEYFEELDAARNHLNSLGILQAPCQGIEADDVIGWFAEKYSSDGHKVILFSDDKDYYQLLKKNVKLWRPCVNEFYELRHFNDEHNFKPKKQILIDALTGQEKDNIPGACDLVQNKDKTWSIKKYGFGPAKAIALLEAADWSLKTLHAMLTVNTVKCNPTHREQLLKNWRNVLLSRKLSKIRTSDEDYSTEEREVLQKAYDDTMAQSSVKFSKVQRVAKTLEFRSLGNKLPSVLGKIGVKVDVK